ncbi:adenylyltransferase/cytidyltransferase family protein [Aestuariimicrobium sp. T2.26MG-19.2B]|uniref:adenylyltransferase/cytidyltransferase family protein n=1 Tax=Aestuariimicrobium sp. T2.26MG-19.2B TaxID=3040679 RepID=UPI002477650A|nr:adenylyltransferase/cytidyltransferase family protein [Aestuariimicrobium sp. T2.26MG-19.2B]CAI9406265.1 Bifunctional protein HldE [Aestuariimicrobium sp. T2.26MG-19.2B]
MDAPSGVGYVIGTFDMLNVAHLSVVNQVRDRCEVLVIGVLSDEAVLRETGHRPITSAAERVEVLRHVRGVDQVVEHDPRWPQEHPGTRVYALGERRDVHIDHIVRPAEYPANVLLWFDGLGRVS